MGVKLLDLPEVAGLLKGRRVFGFHEDFLDFVSGDLFTDTSADSGASWANTDAAGGVVTAATGATDNNEAYLLTTKELFLFAENKPAVFESRSKFTEANTDDANVALGFMSAVAANSILDDGGGPAASYSGALFFKVDGGTNWWVEVSIAGTQTTVELTAVNSLDKTAHTSGGGSYQIHRIEVIPVSSTKADVRFFIDDVLVYVVKDWTYTSVTEMNAFYGVKAGGANSETPAVDYIDAWQAR